MRAISFLLLSTLFLLAPLTEPIFAQGDLDVEGAKRRYETQRQIADRAKSQMELERSRLTNAETRLRNAQTDRQNAQTRLRDAETRLASLERQIISLQREINQLESDLPRQQRELTSAEQDLSRLVRERDRLLHDRSSLESQITRLENRLRELHSAPEPDQAEIARTEAALNRLRSDLTAKNQEISRVEQSVRQAQTRVNNLSAEVQRTQSSIRTKRTDLSNAERSRDRIEDDMSRLRQDLQRAEDDIRRAESEVASQRSVYQSAERQYQSEQSRANELYAYYQQVLANYNRELERIYQIADRAANDHASAESQARAPEAGSALGTNQGRTAGTDKGTADGRARDRVLGYRHGRANAATDKNLADFYARGRSQGADIAQRKAQGEDYPAGYNEALAAALSAEPSHQDTLDIGSELPDDPGQNSPELSTNRMTTTPVNAPNYGMPGDPVVGPPAYATPTFSVPARDNRFHNPPCSNLALEEFVPKCRARYDSTYASQFNSSYQRLFLAAHRSSFDSNARSAYDAALKQNYREQYADGAAQGATEQGVLNGFNETLATARQQKRQEGRTALQQKVGQAHMLVVRSVTLQERDQDGILSPGEFADLVIVVDNLGGAASPKSKLKMEIKSSSGVQQISFNSRELPAIQANTRLTLVGVTRLSPQAVYAGGKMSVEGQILSRNQAGAYVPVQSFTQEAVVNYPLELQDIALEKNPAVGEAVKATFTFKNLSNIVSEDMHTALSTSPAIIEVIDGNDLIIPALQPGESTSVEAQIKPSVNVGENVYSNFVSQISDGAGTLKYAQPFAKLMHLDRTGSILVFDANGRDITSGTINVNAGSTVQIQAQFKFHATQSRRGPFVLRSARMSHSSMRHANGSTVSVNYGAWSPGSQAGRARFSYVIPQSLKGQQVSITLNLMEGQTLLHAQTIYMNVK